MAATPDEPESESEVTDVDEAGQESFPASDPPASWAGPDVIPDEDVIPDQRSERTAGREEPDESQPSGDR